MSRTRTLAQLIDDVLIQADAVGLDDRHDDAELTRYINQSIQELRENVSAAGITHFLTSSSGTLSVGNSTDYPFRILDLSALSPALVRLFGLDVQLTDQRWISLRSVDFSERTQFDDGLSGSGGRIPEAWANITTYTFAILPSPGSAYTYRAWYLPKLADLANDSDTFDGVSGWEQWVVWDVCAKVCIRDQFPEMYQMIIAERERAWRYIISASSRVNAHGGTLLRKDTMGRARMARGRWGR